MSVSTSSHFESNYKTSQMPEAGSSSRVPSSTPHSPNEIRLLGQRIVLKANDKDPELIQEVIHLVSQRLNEAEVRTKGNVPHQVALVALLDLAEEYIQAKKRTIEYQQQLEGYTQNLVDLVEAELK